MAGMLAFHRHTRRTSLLQKAAAVTLVAWALPAVIAHAATPRLTVEIGFGGLYRPGSWTPLYLTVDRDPGGEPLQLGQIEIWAYQDARHTLLHLAELPLAGGRTTFVLPVRMGSLPDGHSIVLRESRPDGSGPAVAHVRLGELAPAQQSMLATPTRLVVLAGLTPTGDLALGDFVTRFVTLARLPEHPALLESVDLLVLNGPGLETLSPRQWSAIETWIRGGGRLLVALPPEGLADDLPVWTWAGVRVGPLVAHAGSLPFLTLRPTAGDVTLIPMDGPDTTSAKAVASIRPWGLGEIRVAPVLLAPRTQASLGKLAGELPARLAADLPPVWRYRDAALASGGWPSGLAATGLIVLVVDELARRRLRRSPGPAQRSPGTIGPFWLASHMLGSSCLLFAALSLFAVNQPQHLAASDAASGEGQASDIFTVMDDLPGGPLPPVRLERLAPSGAFPHPIPPVLPLGTSARGLVQHAHLVARVMNGVPVAEGWPDGVAAITFPGPAERPSTTMSFDAGGMEDSAIETFVETREGLVPRRGHMLAQRPTSATERAALPAEGQSPADQPAAAHRAAAVPEPIRLARRLTPDRSAALQRKLDRGEVHVIWHVRTGGVHRHVRPGAMADESAVENPR